MNEQTKITFYYGLSVVRPSMHVKIQIQPLTLSEWVHCIFIEVWNIFYPSFLFACAVTAFQVAFWLI